MQNGIPRKQHLISKALLDRFANGESGQLRSFDVRYGTPRLRHPSQVGWRLDFVEYEPAEAEALWQEVEGELPEALIAVEDGTVFEQPRAAEILRSTIALHFMRRDVVKATFDDGFVRARRRVRIPPDIPVPREIVEREVTKRLDAERTAMFADHVRSMFEKARMLVARSRLEVIHSPEALLLGDSAVLSVQHDGGVGFIPFADAATHVLPVGRHHLVALAPSDRALELPTKWAHDLNERQVVNARRHVFFSPDDDLEPLVWKMLQRR